MRVSLNNVWLTNDGTTDLPTWTDAHDVSLNGRQIVQDVEFLRAAADQPLARGQRQNRLQFSVTRQHPSVAEAASYALTLFSQLPGSGPALLVCGALGELPLQLSFNAVLETMPACGFHGTRSDVTYVLRGGLITVLGPGLLPSCDAGSFFNSYLYAPGGTLDGGNFADALQPVTLTLDGGTLTP